MRVMTLSNSRILLLLTNVFLTAIFIFIRFCFTPFYYTIEDENDDGNAFDCVYVSVCNALNGDDETVDKSE